METVTRFKEGECNHVGYGGSATRTALSHCDFPEIVCFVLDLQDCFYTILLHPEDTKRFAFSLPLMNLQRPYLPFQWQVFPQEMKNSSTLCQEFVDMALLPIHQQFPELLLFHYMDDICIAPSSLTLLNQPL